MAPIVYKIVPKILWEETRETGVFQGAPIDLADGFIHFSTASQVRETAARYFAGVEDLLLIAIDSAALGDKLAFEPSRGGDLFPHLYASLERAAVVWERPLPIGPDGSHVFPEDL